MSGRWSQEQLETLRQSRDRYLAQDRIAHYDEVLLEVVGRASDTGHVSKADIGALLFWKRLRADTPWASELHLCSDAFVRATTGEAREAMAAHADAYGAARAGRSALVTLPGFRVGDALASAVLTALAPERMAVYDRRAHSGLRLLGVSITDGAGRYGEYMRAVDDLGAALRESGEEWTNRDVDVALFTSGKGVGSGG